MKKHLFKPGFEFIFSLCALVILGLPPLVFGQAVKDLQITINNGDTTINGKNIKTLSAADRKDALKDINQIGSIDTTSRPAMITSNDARPGRKLKVMKLHRGGRDSTMAFTFNSGDGPGHRMPPKDFHGDREGNNEHIGFNRRNTQNFIYTNIDNDGIATHVAYHVMDHPAVLDYDGGKQGDVQMDMLNLTDLNIVPEFSEGKTVLMFSLPSKAVADVKFKDGKGNLVWTAKAVNGTFSKSFALGLNGLYYLQVKQGGKLAVKKIEKE